MLISRRYAISLGVALLAAPALAAQPTVYSNDGVAINGYDPIGYFDESKPVRGNADIPVGWNGATWLFSSVENRDRFVADPESFAPQYGGYCAYAVANGATAPTDPIARTVQDGKLYLNYSLGVRRRWSKDIPNYVGWADENWPEVLQ